MHINEQIDRVFGDINHNDKRQFHSPDSITKQNPKKKSSFKKHTNHNININDDNNSYYSIESIEEINKSYLKENEDNSFYDDFMKKIKEDEKEVGVDHKNSNKKKQPHFQVKPGFLRKEKSQGNVHSKHFLEGKKESGMFNQNNSLITEQINCEEDNNLLKTNHNNKINKKYNCIDSINSKNNRNILNINQTNLSHEKNLNQLTVYSKKGFNLEDEKVQNSIQFQILNKFRKFNELKVETPISFDQIIKGVNFSNVKKLNLNSQNEQININNNNNIIINNNNNNVNENKSTDNANQHEGIYPSSNNLLKTKRNSIFCCF